LTGEKEGPAYVSGERPVVGVQPEGTPGKYPKSEPKDMYVSVCVLVSVLNILGLLVDKDNLINHQLVISYRLLIRILTNQPNVDKTIVLSTNR